MGELLGQLSAVLVVGIQNGEFAKPHFLDGVDGCALALQPAGEGVAEHPFPLSFHLQLDGERGDEGRSFFRGDRRCHLGRLGEEGADHSNDLFFLDQIFRHLGGSPRILHRAAGVAYGQLHAEIRVFQQGVAKGQLNPLEDTLTGRSRWPGQGQQNAHALAVDLQLAGDFLFERLHPRFERMARVVIEKPARGREGDLWFLLVHGAEGERVAQDGSRGKSAVAVGREKKLVRFDALSPDCNDAVLDQECIRHGLIARERIGV